MSPKIYLAPMEGLADHYLRKIITAQGGYDLAISEFVRITDQLLPKRVYLEQVPELTNDAKTESGTPVRVQLLGNHPQALAENALRAIELGSRGVDLNFGCPSKTVNNSKGGAILLKEPETIYRVVSEVRKALGEETILSTKMRLGFDDGTLLWECAHAISGGGANEITVHARTRSQGYTPPAYWHKAAQFEAKLKIPLIINGEIWSNSDASRALKEANCSALMLGRGAVRNPFLAKEIKSKEVNYHNWPETLELIRYFWKDVTLNMSERYCAGRLKQWLNHLQHNHAEAKDLFEKIRKITAINEISRILEI